MCINIHRYVYIYRYFYSWLWYIMFYKYAAISSAFLMIEIVWD